MKYLYDLTEYIINKYLNLLFYLFKFIIYFNKVFAYSSSSSKIMVGFAFALAAVALTVVVGFSSVTSVAPTNNIFLSNFFTLLVVG